MLSLDNTQQYLKRHQPLDYREIQDVIEPQPVDSSLNLCLIMQLGCACKQGMGPVSREQYFQMVGRAGRAGHAQSGEAFLLAKGEPYASSGMLHNIMQHLLKSTALECLCTCIDALPCPNMAQCLYCRSLMGTSKHDWQ